MLGSAPMATAIFTVSTSSNQQILELILYKNLNVFRFISYTVDRILFKDSICFLLLHVAVINNKEV